MDIATLDCGFSVPFFELSLAKFAGSRFSCLFMSNLPRNYSSSIIYQTIFDKVQCVRVSTCLFLIQAPAFFRQLDTGVNDVIAGVVSVGTKHFGLVASFYSDPFGETLNVLRLILPVVLGSLRCLLTGCPDAVGKPVDVCQDIYLVGGLLCRGLPVPLDYLVPAELFNMLGDFPSDFYGSCNFWASCSYVPYLADWQNEEMYLPIDEDFTPVDRVSLLRNFISSLPDGNFHVLDNEERLDKALGLSDLPDFLLSVYGAKTYSRWHTIPNLCSLSPQDNKILFSGIWMQRLRLEVSSSFKTQSCYHFSFGQGSMFARETFLAFASNVGYDFHNGYAYEELDFGPMSACGSADSFAAFIGDCSGILVQDRKPPSVFIGRYIIYRLDIRQAVRWSAVTCVFRTSSMIATNYVGGCLFGCGSLITTLA